MNEALDAAGIDYHECTECGAALEHNVWLDWDAAEPVHPANYVPVVRCATCNADAGAYGAEVTYELLDDVGIDISEATPGERIKPEVGEIVN